MFHCLYMSVFLIHISINRHLSGFNILVIVNNAAVNMGMQYLSKILISISLYKYPEMTGKWHSRFNFLTKLCNIFYSGCSNFLYIIHAYGVLSPYLCQHLLIFYSSIIAILMLKDDAVKVLHSICQQIWKTQKWPQDWKRSVFNPISKKGNAKECSNYHTIALISHASKTMLKILQARLQQYVNCELPGA